MNHSISTPARPEASLRLAATTGENGQIPERAAALGKAHPSGSVALVGVGKQFPSAQGPVEALGGVSLEVRPAEIFGIIGRSGAGKSTLIRLINGLERPTSGTVIVDGTDVAALTRGGLTQLRRRIGMIFQHFNLLSSQTVLGNVAFPLRLSGVSRTEATKRAERMLDLVGLSDKRDAYPARLSGGQKQRVGIARALISNPDILLCDEATSALDPETTRSILALLRDINRRLGITIILITHEMEVIRQICDRVAVLERGQIVETGPVWEVFSAPRASATRALLKSTETADTGFGSQPADHVIELTFAGRDGEPDVLAVTGLLGGNCRLIESELRAVDGRPRGRAVIAVDRADVADFDALVGQLRRVLAGVRLVL